MNKSKKIIVNLLLVMVMLMAFCVPAMATEKSVEVPVVTSDQIQNGAEIGTILGPDKEENSISSSTPTPTVVSVHIYRSGDTSTCNVYLGWVGSDKYNAWRFKSLLVKSTSATSPITYKKFGDGINYKTYPCLAAPAGFVYIGNATIPTTVNKVSVSASGLQGYNMRVASWLSAVPSSGTLTIQ